MRSRKGRSQRLRRISRNAHGAYLVEVLVAIVLSSMIALSMADLIGTSFRVASTTRNEALANQLIKFLLERTRIKPYSELQGYIGEHDLTSYVNKTSLGESDPPLFPGLGRFLFNSADRDWQPKSETTVFSPTSVKYTVTQETPYSLRVSFSVSWKDSTRSKTARTVSASTVRMMNGIRP